MRWAQLNDRLNILWKFLSVGLEWRLTFSSTVAMAEFSKFADILNAALLQLHSIGFLNTSAGIPSPSLALLVVMLPKAHLTSCSSISGLMWVTPASSLPWSLWPLLYSASVHSCHLFLIYLLLLGHWVFCPLLWPRLHDVFLWLLQFFEEIYTLYNYVVFQ